VLGFRPRFSSILISHHFFNVVQVDPGWVIVLPIEGEYTIHVQNLRNKRTGVDIYIDGFKNENKRFLGLDPHQTQSLKCHIIKTEDEFELEGSRGGSLIRRTSKIFSHVVS
jgi:hypothetical protein